ncbi:MAG: metallophosphoesterase family protein, partial [Rhodospirillales bacterium]
AYCGRPSATVKAIRDSGVHVVMGNCEESLGNEAEGCGCGFEPGTACDRLAVEWYAYADRAMQPADRAWMRGLPRRLDIGVAGKRLAVIHGGVSRINRYIFASTPAADKLREIELAGTDGVIGGHCGLPFTQTVAGKLWHNPGAIGLPANDGTPRVWFSILVPGKAGIRIEHRALAYRHRDEAAAMRAAGLIGGYAEALETGLWPSCDVLPPAERAVRGSRLEAGGARWPVHARADAGWP